MPIAKANLDVCAWTVHVLHPALSRGRGSPVVRITLGNPLNHSQSPVYVVMCVSYCMIMNTSKPHENSHKQQWKDSIALDIRGSTCLVFRRRVM